jgi:K+-sensing histidine kinase KdpD
MQASTAYTSIGLLLMLLVDWLDYLSGHEVNFFVFYFLPIAFVSWYTNRKVATFFAVVVTGNWLIVNYLEGAPYSHWFIPYWNAGVRLAAFLTIALAFAFIRQQLRQAQRLNQELAAALAEVKRLSGFLPICASCKKIRNDHGSWEQIETYIRDRSEAEFTHSLCPECVSRIYPDLAR